MYLMHTINGFNIEFISGFNSRMLSIKTEELICDFYLFITVFQKYLLFNLLVGKYFVAKFDTLFFS